MDTPRCQCYCIRVKGHLGQAWLGVFEGMEIENLANGEAVLYGRVRDQAELRGLVERVFDMGLPLLSVGPSEPALDTAIDILA